MPWRSRSGDRSCCSSSAPASKWVCPGSCCGSCLSRPWGGVLAALIHLLQTEAERRTEARLLLQRGELGPENYDNLR